MGELYSKQGKNVETEVLLLRALEGRERVLGADHTLTLETVSSLSNVYRLQGSLCQALK
jgi:hypothetical protein